MAFLLVNVSKMYVHRLNKLFIMEKFKKHFNFYPTLDEMLGTFFLHQYIFETTV